MIKNQVFFFFGIYRINEDTMLIGKLFEHIVRMHRLSRMMFS